MASSLFDIEIDGVRQGVVEVTNPFPQTIELGLAPFEGLNDGKPHQIRLVEAAASELNWFQCQGQFFDSNRYKITTVTGEKSVSTAWPPY